MSQIEVHAGDFLKGRGAYGPGVILLRTKKHTFIGERIRTSEIAEIALASDENIKKLGGTLGWGAAGALVLGPVGLLAGLLLGGQAKNVTFVAKFRDGRKLLATTDHKTYVALQAAAFK